MDSFAFGNFVLEDRHLSHRGVPVKLTAKSAAVLEMLARSAPATVSRAEFESEIWPEGFIEPANLTQTIYMIRRALAAHSAEPIVETLNARGYRIGVPVERRSGAPLAQPAGRRGLFARLASSLALGFGVAVAASFVGAHGSPLPAKATHHAIVDHPTGGTARNALAAPLP